MDPARARSHERRKARRSAREAEFARDDARALAINPRIAGHGSYMRAVRALIANPAARDATLCITGLLALCSLAWVIGRAAQWW